MNPVSGAFHLGWNPETLSQSLGIMGKGMLGIFAVIAVIYVVVWGLNKFTKPSDQDKKNS